MTMAPLLTFCESEGRWGDQSQHASVGSFENEALENEDRSTKHPNLENEDP